MVGNYRIVKLGKEYILPLISLSNSLGWDYDQPEISTLMETGEVYGHLTATGRLVSSGAVIKYREGLSSIGMVMVDPMHRRLGLGNGITKQCLDRAGRNSCTMLISTPEGYQLYEGLGFRQIGNVYKFVREQHDIKEIHGQDISIFPLEAGGLDDIMDMDMHAFGTSRRDFLHVRLRQATEAWVALNLGGKVGGYIMCIDTPANTIIGPLVAEDDRIAIKLLVHVISRNPNRMRIDLLSNHISLSSMLYKNGFYLVSTPPVMTYNGTNLPERNGNLYSVSAQVFG